MKGNKIAHLCKCPKDCGVDYGVGVVERNVSYGQRGPTFEDVVSALYRRADVPVRNYVVGLGGRDIRVLDLSLGAPRLISVIRSIATSGQNFQHIEHLVHFE